MKMTAQTTRPKFNDLAEEMDFYHYMRMTAQTIPRTVEVDVSMEEIIECLKEKCGVRESHDCYYSVSDNKLYKHTDVSYHGSPVYEDTLVSEDPNVIIMYESIVNFEKAYKNRKSEE